MSDTIKQLTEKVKQLGLKNTKRHIFICADQSNAKCCSLEQGQEAWAYLKKRLVELGQSGENCIVQRSRANCLRVCQEGPIAVVYPDGIWYGNCNPVNLEKIIQQHLLGGKPVVELIICDPNE